MATKKDEDKDKKSTKKRAPKVKVEASFEELLDFAIRYQKRVNKRLRAEEKKKKPK